MVTEAQLKKMMIPGMTVEFHLHTFEGKRVLSNHLWDMKNKGHAISVDETKDHEGKSLGVRVFHWLTCRACQDQKERGRG
jgi:hypothetical protein